MTQIVIQIDAPVATLERFSQMTGVPFETVKKRAQSGKYPIMPKSTPQERPQINLVAFCAEAAALARLPASSKERTKQAR